jgi:hypothetical protein
MLGIPDLTRAVINLGLRMERVSTRLSEAIDAHTKALYRLMGPPAPQGPITFRVTGEADMAIVYEADLPQLPADHPQNADVVRGEIRLQFDGAAQAPIETAIGATTHAGIRVPEGTLVSGEFVFIDNASNPSVNPVALAPFTASDTVPPPDAEGGFGLRAVGEEA